MHCFQSWGSGVRWSSFQNKEGFINIFHWLGVLVRGKNSKILLRIFLEEGPGPCPKAALLFPNCSSLPPLPSLISSCLNWSLGNSGKVMEAEVYSPKQERGDPERLVCPGAHRGLLGFRWINRYMYSSEIFGVPFQTTAIKQILH